MKTDSGGFLTPVCWFCGQEWSSDCPGARTGRHPVWITEAQCRSWLRTKRQPRASIASWIDDERYQPPTSAIEAAYRRGVHQALSIACQYRFTISELAIAESKACDLRYDDKVHMWLMHEVLEAVWKKRVAGNACPICGTQLSRSDGGKICRRCNHVIMIRKGMLLFEPLEGPNAATESCDE